MIPNAQTSLDFFKGYFLFILDNLSTGIYSRVPASELSISSSLETSAKSVMKILTI
jgi:hypothetical protein